MANIPEMMPVLSRGKHYHPRSGGCFMELASYLASERWSDHPACTHPVLAEAARLVNDWTSDRARPRLAPLAPQVIGQRDLGESFSQDAAVIAALRALPVVALGEQRALAVGLMRIIMDAGEPPHVISPGFFAAAQEALEDQPAAKIWAEEFIASVGDPSPNRQVSTKMVSIAIPALGAACISDVDKELCELLTEIIDWAHKCSGTDPHAIAPLKPEQWQDIMDPALEPGFVLTA